MRNEASQSNRRNSEALEVLLERDRPALLRLCKQRLRDHHLAEDVVQDVFLRAIDALPRLDISKPIWPWLVTVAERRCIDLSRRMRRVSLVDIATLSTLDETGFSSPSSVGSRFANDCLEELIAAENRIRLSAQLMKLSLRQRRALLLFALEGWSYEDIASAEGVSIGAIKLLLSRARQKLRAACERGLGIVLTTVEGAKFRLRELAMRARLETSGEKFGLGFQSFATGLLALTVGVASTLGGSTPEKSSPTASSYLARTETSDSVAAGEFPHGALPSKPATDSAPPSKPVTDGGSERSLIETILAPRPDDKPEDTHFESFAASPSYEQDHTVFAAGSCRDFSGCYALFVSRDGGEGWTRLPALGLAGWTIAVSPGFPIDQRIFATGASGLQESTDGGTTFRTVGPIGTWKPGGLAISPAFSQGDPRVLVVHPYSGEIFEHQGDTGLTLPLRLHGTEPQSQFLTAAFSPSYLEDRVLLLSGQSWAATLGADVLGFGRTSYRCRNLSCQGYAPRAYSGIPTDLRFSPNFGHDGVVFGFNDWWLSFSADGGSTFSWRQFGVGNPVFDLAVAWWSGSFGQTLYAAGWGGIRRSFDGGSSWTQVSVGLPGFNSTSRILVLPSGRILVAGGGWGIACSDDGGVTWRPLCSPEP